MANERFADLTEAEMLELMQQHPAVARQIIAQDPRVQLMERLYGDPDGKRAIETPSKRLFPKARIESIALPAEVRAELAEDISFIKETRKSLEDDAKARRHASFRSRLQEHGAADADLDAIEAFMVDNEIGPKSMRVA